MPSPRAMRACSDLGPDRSFFAGGKLKRGVARDECESRLARLADAAERCREQRTGDMLAGMGDTCREVRPYRVARGRAMAGNVIRDGRQNRAEVIRSTTAGLLTLAA